MFFYTAYYLCTVVVTGCVCCVLFMFWVDRMDRSIQNRKECKSEGMAVTYVEKDCFSNVYGNSMGESLMAFRRTSIILLLIPFLFGFRLHRERWYQDKFCEGKKEVVMEDRTRVDCLTNEYAIEYDFAKKWYEAVGQALHYSRLTGKKPGIVLILEKENDPDEVYKLLMVIEHFGLGIEVWTVDDK